MALQRANVPVMLSGGLGQKTDDKILGPGQASAVENVVFDKDGRVTKRFGQSAQAQTFTYDPAPFQAWSNAKLPAGFAAGAPSKVFPHEKQLCVANNGGLYAQVQGQNTWRYQGAYVPLSVSTKQVDADQRAFDVAVVQGVTITGGGNKVTVTETATGTTLAVNTFGSATETVVRVIGFQNAAYVLTADVQALQGVNCYPVSLTTGQIGQRNSIISDFNFSGTDLNQRALCYQLVDVAVTTGSALGEVALIAYPSLTNVKIVALNNLGVLAPFLGFDTGVPSSVPQGSTTVQSTALYIEPSVNPNAVYFASATAAGGVKVTAYTLSSTTLTSVYTATSFAGLSSYFYHLSLALDPRNNADIHVFASTKFNPQSGYRYYPNGANYPTGIGSGVSTAPAPAYLGFPHSFDCSLFQSVISSTGTVKASRTLAQGVILAAKAYRDLTRGTIYVPATLLSKFQSSLFLYDALSAQTSIQAKWMFEQASVYNQVSVGTLPATSSLWSIPQALFLNPVVFKDASTSQTFTLPLSQWAALSATSFAFANTGTLSTVELRPKLAPNHAYTAQTTHLTGGLLWAYDGQSLSEHNFLAYPEVTDIVVGGVSATMTTAGTPSVPQAITLAFHAAQYYAANNPLYYQFNTTTKGWVLTTTVEGKNLLPSTPGYTQIVVALSGTDTPGNVMQKCINAIIAAGVDVSITQTGTAQILLTNNSNGAVAAPGVSSNLGSNCLAASSSYQYCATFMWTDKNGNVYRSAPSVPLTVQTGSGASTGTPIFTVWCPPITMKSNVTVEIWRTKAFGSTFYKVSPNTYLPPLKIGTGNRVQFYDQTPDSTIESNEPIYVDGGVMENFSVGACTSVATFKNRLMVTLVDDPTAVYYSKSLVTVPGKREPINFAQDNAMRFDTDSRAVTATAAMDDKLVVLKERSIYVTAGDGSNDLGQAESFQLPLRIPGDYGTLNPNSLVLSDAGLIFQTPNRGIQVLDRSLQIQYIGQGVDDYKLNTVSSAVPARNYEHIVFGLQDSGVSLVYNTRFNRWDTWTNQRSDAACVWQSTYVRVSNSGKVYVEGTGYFDVDGSSAPVLMAVETPWLKVQNLQSFQRVYSFALLGEYKSPHTLTFTLRYDYDPILSNADTYTVDAGALFETATGRGDKTYQVQVQPRIQKCEAMKVRVSEAPTTGTGESALWNAIELEVGLKPGLNKVKASKSI